jgi:RND family efflux transporter MFP subunit
MNLQPLKKLVSLLALLTPLSALGNGVEVIVEAGFVESHHGAAVAELPGTIVSTRDAQIRAEVEGRIDWIAPVGTWVDAGDPLVTLNDELLNMQLRRDRAELARLQTDIEVRRRQQARLEQLAGDDNLAEFELERVAADIDMLGQDLVIAEVALARTQYALDRSALPAPFAGIVVEQAMSEGEFTAVGSPLVRLVDTASLEISVAAPMRIARVNKAGQAVTVISETGESLETVRSVVPVGDAQSRTVELRIAIPGDGHFIGDAVTVALPESTFAENLTIPRDALVLRDSGQFVFRISDEGMAERVAIETMAGLGNRLAINVLSGSLAPGARVVVRGAENLREGQAVKLMQAGLSAR